MGIKKIYDLEKAREAIIEAFTDQETGDLIDKEAMCKYLDENDAEYEKNVESVAITIKDSDDFIERIDKEIKRLTAMKKTETNRVKNLKSGLADCLKGKKFKTEKFTISYRRSEAVEIVEGASVPDEFLVEQAPKVDKVGLKRALKGGAVIDGVSLVERQNILIR